MVKRRGGGKEYSAHALLGALDLSQHISDRADLKSVCEKARKYLTMLGPPGTPQPEVVVPSPATLSRSLFRIDVLLTCKRQEVWKERLKTPGWVILCSDSSGIGQKEWFLTEEDYMAESDSHLFFETKSNPASQHVVTRTCLTPVVLGSGLADLPHKLARLVHQVRLELGTRSAMEQYFGRVISYISDMGVEHSLVTVPNVDLDEAAQEVVQTSDGLLALSWPAIDRTQVIEDDSLDTLDSMASNGIEGVQ